MTAQKSVTYNILDTIGQVSNEKCDIKLNVLENSGNYLIHKDITRHRILRRQNTVSTKTRSEVSGGGRKPWRQKGTGRARAGSNRSPLWRGGGVIFGPKPRNLTVKLNKKERNLALQTLLYNNRKNTIIVPENSFEVNKTKQIVQIIKNCKVPTTTKILIVVAKKTKSLFLSTRNIKNVELILSSNLNTLSLLKAEHIIITSSGLTNIKETFCD
jgi:large subunit ribosomal protein L4